MTVKLGGWRSNSAPRRMFSAPRVNFAIGVLLALTLIITGCASSATDAAVPSSTDTATATAAAGGEPIVTTGTTAAAGAEQPDATATAAPEPTAASPLAAAAGGDAVASKPQAAAAATPAPSRKEVTTYTVRQGDTVSALAQKFGISAETIVTANNMASEDELAVGQELRIPPMTGVLHRVKSGDTLEALAALYDADANAIAQANGLTDPDALEVDQEIVIPDGQLPSREMVASRSGQRPGPLKPSTYIVQEGDSLSAIADRFGISVETLLWSNQFDNPDEIQPGTELIVLPVSGVLYTVQDGDSLNSLSKRFSVPVDEILMANGIADPDTIVVGDKLLLPGGAPEPAAPAPPPPQPTPKPAPAVATKPAAAAPAAAPAPAPAAKPAPAAAPASRGSSIVAVAQEYVGYPYVWGGTSPNVGFDCTGFVYWVLNRRLGIPITRDLWGQLGFGTRVSRAQVQTGDLVFFQNTYTSGLSHVGIALDNSRFVHAASERYGVIVSRLDDAYWSAHWYGASRP